MKKLIAHRSSFIAQNLVFGILFVLFFLYLVPLTLNAIFAQENISFGVTYQIQDSDVKDGDIISYKNNVHYKSKGTYDQNLFGVVSTNPAIALTVDSSIVGYLVVTSGVSFINVNTQNGPIKKGDYITSSSTPGVGMKAGEGGFIIGIALTEYDSAEKTAVGQVKASINATYAGMRSFSQGTFGEIFNLSAIAATGQPSMVIKYLAAGIVLIISFAVGFILFGKVAIKGVEALGRNPMARGTIQFGIILNVLITVSIVFSGLLISYLMLRL